MSVSPDNDKVTVSFFVLFNAKGEIEYRKTSGFDLKPGWVATEVEISAPKSAFLNPPIPRVSIDVPEGALRRTFIDAAAKSGEKS